jgi:hypothetical protein
MPTVHGRAEAAVLHSAQEASSITCPQAPPPRRAAAGTVVAPGCRQGVPSPRLPPGWAPRRRYESHAVFYVGVPDVEAALQRAESLGGIRVMGPARSPNGLVVGHFTDPEGTLIGVAGVA